MSTGFTSLTSLKQDIINKEIQVEREVGKSANEARQVGL